MKLPRIHVQHSTLGLDDTNSIAHTLRAAPGSKLTGAQICDSLRLVLHQASEKDKQVIIRAPERLMRLEDISVASEDARITKTMVTNYGKAVMDAYSFEEEISGFKYLDRDISKAQAALKVLTDKRARLTRIKNSNPGEWESYDFESLAHSYMSQAKQVDLALKSGASIDPKRSAPIQPKILSSGASDPR